MIKKIIFLCLSCSIVLSSCDNIDPQTKSILDKMAKKATASPALIKATAGNVIVTVSPTTSASPVASPSSSPLTDAKEIEKVTILPLPLSINIGDTINLKAEVKYKDNTTSSDVIWNVDKKDLASISETGELKIIADGTVVITATAKDNPEKSVSIFARAGLQSSASPTVSVASASPSAQTQFGMIITTITPKDGNISIDIYKNFQYINQGWPYNLSVGQTASEVLTETPYETLTSEPKYATDKPLYGFFKLGNGTDNKITYVVDTSKWVVYLDKNNNNDLTDDGAYYSNQGTGKFAALISMDIDIAHVTGQTFKQPYQLWFWLNDQNKPYFYSRCHYMGRISINNATYNAVAFEKEKHDGLYKESGIYIDLNNDAQMDETNEFFADGSSLTIGGASYKIELLYP